MEQDCVVGLYQSVGRAVGEPLSAEDVSHLFGKVFHETSNAEEVHAAITTISNGNRDWTCAGHNVLHVLGEMEQQRVKSEKLYWERQLLNAVNYHSGLPVTDTPVISDQNKQGSFFQSSPQKTIHLPNMGIKEGMLNVRKAHRQSWARLVVEGLSSLLPSPPGSNVRARSQAWGSVTVSDIILLIEVKYDVVSSLLYTEMLREHYSADVWENLTSREQCEAEKGLGCGAGWALESHDLLHLAQLPGAFNMYRFQNQCWSAVSFLYELQTHCQQEKSALEDLAPRLNMESMKLVCLHIRLATHRAQREKDSYGAVLAARQCWESWPDVFSPQRAEQAAFLLQSEDHEHKVEPVSQIPCQAVLQLLVLTQEQERRQLIKLLHGFSHEELQGQGGTEDGLSETSEKASELRVGFVRRLQQIYTSTKIQTQLEPTIQNCGLQLLLDLLRLQETEALVLLPRLLNKSQDALQSLQEDFRTALQAQCLPNLLQLLSSDQPQTCSTNEHKSNLPHTSPAEDHVPSTQAVNEASEAPVQPDVCTGCGAAMASLPYLEVLGVSSTLTSGSNEQAKEETGNNAEELQASLIPLAWSKPPNPSCLAEGGPQTSENNLQQTICETYGEDHLQYCNSEQEKGELKVCAAECVSAVEREQAMRSLVDLQRRVEQRQQRDRERQLLKVQERLSIIQSRKLRRTSSEDFQQQKAVVRERLDQLRRERSYILQSKRDRNTAGFKELLGPAGQYNKIKENVD
ncbi:hypothetical protein WMY93_024121 [Mugilogobius chulae]|uniref:Uncharacterized protein n=1 Tax=Mugilogobius chulae TaxID=88201 RepID=A0AAW0NB43_9GOBI